MKFAFLLYPTSQVKVNEDSSFWILYELQRRGHQVFYFESKQFFLKKNKLFAFLTPARLDLRNGYLPSPPLKEPVDLSSMDCLFIRKEPPFTGEYLHTLQLLGLLRGKVWMINDPQGILLCNEKLLTLSFPRFIPETLVTENLDEARSFIRSLGKKVVVKPLNNKAGHGIFFTFPKDDNLSPLLDLATQGGREKVLIQRLIPHAPKGDRRILVLNGRPMGVFRRRPPVSDFRGNLSVGATMHRCALTTFDKKLAQEIAPQLLKNGLFFVGVDCVGDYLIEVNVTSPSGIPEMNTLYHTHVERKVVDFLEKTLRNSP